MNLKLLAKDTAVYGLSSIVGKFLNYLLVVLYSYAIPAAYGGWPVTSAEGGPCRFATLYG